MQILYLMCGWSFSGKSHIAGGISKMTGAKIIALDKLNEERGIDNNREISIADWESTHKIAVQQLKIYLDEGKSVIIDDTNPLFTLRERFRKVAKQKGLHTTIIYIDVPIEEIEKRINEIEKNDQRHIAPLSARKNLMSIFERPNPKIEDVIVYDPRTDLDIWLKENFKS